MSKLSLYSISALIFIFSLSEVSAQVSKKTAKKIDKIFSQWDKPDRPGGAVSVAQDGEIIFSKGYGLANMEYDIPNSPTTVFHIASVSKQFTTFAILLLEKDGKLSLDDDIRKYLPEVPDFGKTITLRHLAHHTSGLRDQWNLLVMAGWRMDDVITLDHIMNLVRRQKELNYEPGEEHLYCNTGFTLLAEIVARVSGKSFAEFTKNRIFKPLKMKNTLFYVDHEKIVPNRAYSYHRTNNGYKKSVLNYANAGATSLFTTVEDLSLWAMNFEKPRVGDQAIIDKMNTRGMLNDGRKIPYTLGQFIGDYKGLRTIGHGGADAAYRTQLTRFPDQNLSVSVFSNLGQSNPSMMALEVAELFLEEEIAKNKSNDEAPKTELPPPPKDLDLSPYEANYWNDRGGYSRKIYAKNGQLMYNRGGNNESPLAPVGEHKFKMMNVDADLYVEFSKNDDGEKNMLVYEEDDPANESVAYEPIDYSAEALKAFSGRYYSPELETFYDLEVEGDQLIARHIRHGNIKLHSIKENLFSTNVWFLGQVKFQKDATGKINGMKISRVRVRDVWFERQ